MMSSDAGDTSRQYTQSTNPTLDPKREDKLIYVASNCFTDTKINIIGYLAGKSGVAFREVADFQIASSKGSKAIKNISKYMGELYRSGLIEYDGSTKTYSGNELTSKIAETFGKNKKALEGLFDRNVDLLDIYFSLIMDDPNKNFESIAQNENVRKKEKLVRCSILENYRPESGRRNKNYYRLTSVGKAVSESTKELMKFLESYEIKTHYGFDRRGISSPDAIAEKLDEADEGVKMASKSIEAARRGLKDIGKLELKLTSAENTMNNLRVERENYKDKFDRTLRELQEANRKIYHVSEEKSALEKQISAMKKKVKESKKTFLKIEHKPKMKIITEKKEILDLYEDIEENDSLPMDRVDPRIARLGNIISSKVMEYVPGSSANTMLENVRKILEKTKLPEKDQAYYKIESEVEAFFKGMKGKSNTSEYVATFASNLRKSIRKAGGTLQRS